MVYSQLFAFSSYQVWLENAFGQKLAAGKREVIIVKIHRQTIFCKSQTVAIMTKSLNCANYGCIAYF